jgi:ABC-type branched-subunit amino acid transport system substrate-binding protein
MKFSTIAVTLFFMKFIYADSFIGYGSATSVTTVRIQEHFYLGFQLGLESILGAKQSGQLLLERRAADNSPLASLKVAESLVSLGSVGLFGFPTSHEALLVADYARGNNIFSVFAGASHSDLAKKGNFIFTTGTPMSYGIEMIVPFLESKFKKQRGLAVINPYAVFSVDQEKVLKELLLKNSSIDIEFEYLSKELQLSDNAIRRLKAGDFNYLYITPYPEDLFRFFNQLGAHKIDLPLLAAASWGTADPEIVIQRFLTQNKSDFYMSSEWVKGRPESQLFENRLKTRYKREAIPEIAYGYDVGIIAGQLVRRLIEKKLPLTSKALHAAMIENPCFDQLSIGKLCFDRRGGHAIRPIFILKFTKSGFVVLSENKNYFEKNSHEK